MTNRLLVVVGRLSFHGLQTHTRTYTLQIGCINCHQVQAAILYGKLCLVFEAKWTFQAHQWSGVVVIVTLCILSRQVAELCELNQDLDLKSDSLWTYALTILRTWTWSWSLIIRTWTWTWTSLRTCYHPWMRLWYNSFGRICLPVSCSCCNFWKPWSRKWMFWYADTSSEYIGKFRTSRSSGQVKVTGAKMRCAKCTFVGGLP